MNSPTRLSQVVEIVKELPVAPSFKSILLKDLERAGGSDCGERLAGWTDFCEHQRGSGILQQLKSRRDAWIRLSQEVGFEHGLVIEKIIPKIPIYDNPTEYLAHLRSVFTLNRDLDAAEKLRADVGFSYLMLELTQAAYLRNHSLMKRTWKDLLQIADQRKLKLSVHMGSRLRYFLISDLDQSCLTNLELADKVQEKSERTRDEMPK